MFGMRNLLLVAAFCFISVWCRAQQKLLSYDDLAYMITNNLQRTDSFMQSKGYTKVAVNKVGNLKFNLKMPGSTTSEVTIRSDGKRVYIYITTDELQQYNLINNSIAPYLLSREETMGVQAYRVKDLGIIYILINEKVPYSPINKDYDIQLVSDPTITFNN
jgi:outer membrane lipoprotein-sorting protein